MPENGRKIQQSRNQATVCLAAFSDPTFLNPAAVRSATDIFALHSKAPEIRPDLYLYSEKFLIYPGLNVAKPAGFGAAISPIPVFSLFRLRFFHQMHTLADSKWTNETLIAAIKRGGMAQNEAVKYLYFARSYRNPVFKIVLDGGGSQQDALDVLQESMAQLVENLLEDRFLGLSSLPTYFFAIAENMWRSLRRKEMKYGDYEPTRYDRPVEGPEAMYLKEEFSQIVDAALAELGDKCRDLLSLDMLEYSMAEIAQQLGYNNQDVAKNLASRCRMRFRELLKTNPAWSSLLKNKTL